MSQDAMMIGMIRVFAFTIFGGLFVGQAVMFRAYLRERTWFNFGFAAFMLLLCACAAIANLLAWTGFP